MPALCHALWRYLREGGAQNAEEFLRCIGHRALGWGREAQAPPRAAGRRALSSGARHARPSTTGSARWTEGAPVAAILFYRAHLQSGNTAVFDALIDALEAEGMNPLPIAMSSLKDAVSREVVQQLCADHGASLVLNTTAFAARRHRRSARRSNSRAMRRCCR